MKKTLVFRDLQVESGQRLQTLLPVPGTDVTIPVTIINGAQDGALGLVTSGIHSGEYPGIQCAIELAREIDPAEVCGALVFVHPCNPTGFSEQISYFVPEDGKNLGHCFPGDAQGTLSDRIGHALASHFVVPECAVHLDLHGGDLHERLSTFAFVPKNGTEYAKQKSMELSMYMNVKYIVMTGTGLSNYCVQQNIPSIVLERGDRGLITEEEVQYYKRDVVNALRVFDIVPGDINYHGPKPYIFEACDMEYSPVSGCWYRFVELEEHFVKGQKLGEVRDFFGNVLHTVYAKYDGVVHSYWAALSIRKGQLMVGYGA